MIVICLALTYYTVSTVTPDFNYKRNRCCRKQKNAETTRAMLSITVSAGEKNTVQDKSSEVAKKLSVSEGGYADITVKIENDKLINNHLLSNPSDHKDKHSCLLKNKKCLLQWKGSGYTDMVEIQKPSHKHNIYIAHF